MSKQFDAWNQLKTILHNSDKELYFKERDIFWASIGINIGYEQDGKDDFKRLKIKLEELLNVL
jgi:mRNA interferase MazF